MLDNIRWCQLQAPPGSPESTQPDFLWRAGLGDNGKIYMAAELLLIYGGETKLLDIANRMVATGADEEMVKYKEHPYISADWVMANYPDSVDFVAKLKHKVKLGFAHEDN